MWAMSSDLDLHAHSHTRPSSHATRHRDRRRLWWALGLTAMIAVVEAVGGWATHSLALLSDAGHMVTDFSALGLSLVALWFCGRPATDRKTYGYYRLEILAALLNGIVLIGLTGWIILEGISRLKHPAPIQVGPMAVVALIGLVANLGSLAFLHSGHSMSVRSAFLHVLGDALSSVGVLVAALLIAWHGWTWVDPLISFVIGGVIVFGSFRLVRDAVNVLLEAVPQHVELDSIKTLMVRIPGVTAVHDLHVWTISSGMYALSAHLVVDDPMTSNNDVILSAVKHDLMDQFGIDHTTIQIESSTFLHAGEIH